MEALKTLNSRLVPLPVDHVDTDQIIPARFLKTTTKQRLGEQLFYDWRYDEAGRLRPEFVLNQKRHRGAQILLAGENFGCGSSREHAPWALLQYGFRVVIAPSFGDIFVQNALQNGLLPVRLSQAEVRELFEVAESEPSLEITVDLRCRTVMVQERLYSFAIDPFARQCLLEGTDPLTFILKQDRQIERFERRRRPFIDTRHF